MRQPALACTDCGAALAPPVVGSATGEEVWCEAGHRYAVVAGIIDCRAGLIGYDAEADHRLAVDLDDAAAAGATFSTLLERYWAANPGVSAHLAARFVRGDLIAADRAGEVADQIAAEITGSVGPGSLVLEVGSGTAALGAALAQRAGWVIATDVSLAWLVLARQRIELAGLKNVTLVAATAEFLPFGPGSFDLVVAADVIEHVPDAGAMVTACHRALRPGGSLWLSTPNRLSLTPEPHVRLWGVGWLPRPLALAYVRRFRDVDYCGVRTLSSLRLMSLLRRTGGQAHVSVPPIAVAVRATYGTVGRRLIDGYHLARRLPGTRHALLAVAPLFHATLHKPGSGR